MECKLFSMDGGHQPIVLPHAKPVIVGRGPLTRITDKRISREQVALTADYESREVALKQLGSNPGAMGHSVIKQGTVLVIKPAEMFSLLQKKYRYNIQFIDTSDPLEASPAKDSRFSRHEIYRKSDVGQLGHYVNSSPIRSPGRKSDDESRSTDSEMDPDIMTKGKQGKGVGRVSSFKKKLRASFARKKERGHDHTDGASDDGGHSGNEGEVTPKGTRKISPMSALMRVSQTELYLFGCDTAPCSASGSDVDDSEVEDTRKEFGDDLYHELNKVRERTRTSTSKRSSLVLEVPLLTVKGEAQWILRDDLLIYCGKDLAASSQIAAFGYSGTLITTQSGESLPENADDWRVLYGNSKTKLNELVQSGFKIVIFTNEKSLGKYTLSVDDFKRQVEQLELALAVSIQCFVSTGKDVFKMPSPGMWDLLCREFNHSMDVSREKSFFVGDAAGRLADDSMLQTEDHSCRDRCFARNVGVTFYTPQEFFEGASTQSFSWPHFDPHSIYRDTSPVFPLNTVLCPATREIVVMVGWPGSGKTAFVSKHLMQGSTHSVSCNSLDSCSDALRQGHSVVVDASNPSVESRNGYLTIASEHGVPCRCFHMTTTEGHSRHNAMFRDITTQERTATTRTSNKAFRSYNASFEAPSIEEGFTAVVPINFIPSFNDKSKERLYFSFLV